jgi:thiol-disulfide isomerase/thioredoxin
MKLIRILSSVMIIGASSLFYRNTFAHARSFASSMSTSAKGLTEKAIKDNNVMVFSKSYCPYCAKTKSTLQGLGIKFGVFELDVSALHMIITI